MPRRKISDRLLVWEGTAAQSAAQDSTPTATGGYNDNSDNDEGDGATSGYDNDGDTDEDDGATGGYNDNSDVAVSGYEDMDIDEGLHKEEDEPSMSIDNEEDVDSLFDQDAMNAADKVQEVPWSLYEADLDSDDDDYGTSPVLVVATPSPPSSPPSSPDNSETESVQHHQSHDPISPFHIAFGLWCEKSSVSRTDYRRLREIWHMGQALSGITNTDDTPKLPAKLDTLKRIVRTQLPMLRLLRRPINVVIDKQPTFPAGQKQLGKGQRISIERKSWHYWYDPLDLVTRILSADGLTKKMHFGFAHFVDHPEELWESRAWGSSAMTTSGQFARTQHDNAIIIPGDIVRLSNTVEGFTKGRIIFVGRDFRSTANIRGEVLITFQPVISYKELEVDIEGIFIDEQRELLLLDTTFNITPEMVNFHLEVEMFWEYKQTHDEVDDIQDPDSRYFIRHIVDPIMWTAKPIRFMHPTRGDLEVLHYGRDVIEEFASDERPSMSLPLILFVDDFGVHRNMYRALKGFYITPAALDYTERRKPANEFTLTLGPHGASFADIVRNIEPGMQQLGRGVVLQIGDQATLVKAFPMVLTGDMPQAADNSGFMRHNAAKGCRACFCTQEERGDMHYDVITHGRYHFDTVFTRDEGQQLTRSKERTDFFKTLGMREEPPAILPLVPALDLILGRGYDAPHSEWRGIGRIVVGLLLNNILTKHGRLGFIKAMQTFPFPYNWPRIQSPLHLFSWSLSETGRALILIPLILRCCGKSTWYKMTFMQVLGRRMVEFSPIHNLIALFRLIADAVAQTGTRLEVPLSATETESLIAGSRSAFLCLVECMEALNPTVVPVDENENDDDDDGEGFPSLSDIEDEEETISLPDKYNDGLADDNAEGDFNVLGTSESPSPGRSHQPAHPITKWEKLKRLPNVHVGLHIADNVREYAHVMNCNVLTGELTHAKWKSWADAAAPPNLMAYLFAKDNIQQSLRLGFAGAWTKAFPDLSDPIAIIESNCPQLVKSFVPPSERVEVEATDADDTACEVREDASHTEVSVQIKSYQLSPKVARILRIEKHLLLLSLLTISPFRRLLCQAFDNDYGIRNIVQFTLLDRIQWFQRVSFTNNSKRWTFNIGDFCTIRDNVCRIQQLGVVKFQDHRYLFFITTRFEFTGIEDTVLPAEVLRSTRDIIICGLPAVAAWKDWMIKAPADGPWLDVYDGNDNIDDEEDPGEGFYIMSQWRLDVM